MRHEPKLYTPTGPVTGKEGTYTIAFLGCSCGWNSDGESYKKEGDWSDHLAAPQPDRTQVVREHNGPLGCNVPPHTFKQDYCAACNSNADDSAPPPTFEEPLRGEGLSGEGNKPNHPRDGE